MLHLNTHYTYIFLKNKWSDKSFHMPFLSFTSGARIRCNRNGCELVMETWHMGQSAVFFWAQANNSVLSVFELCPCAAHPNQPKKIYESSSFSLQL